MPTIQMLSAAEKNQFKNDLEEYYTLDEDGDLMSYLTEMDVADGEVEVRFFPTPEQGPVEGIYFEVSVYDDAPWKEDLGAYSADNLWNGGPHYEQLAEELETLVQEATGVSANFVKDKGSGAFTEEIRV